MPLPMVHLDIAVLFEESLQGHVEQAPFYLGNIAPDSIHMREGWTRADKENTHFNPKDKNEREYVEQLKERYSTYIQQQADEGWKWFVRGYFMHVLTDFYWFRSVHPQFVEQVTITDQDSGINRTKDELGRLYYQETDQIDFNLYHHASWSEGVWQMLEIAPGYDVADLLTSEEILHWRDRTFFFFNESTNEPGVVPQYITDVKISAFVADTAHRLKVLLQGWDTELQHANISI
ncbi:hypothetical protein ACFTRD_04330 [Paenibacillus sp. NPDC056933]|uniref:hypothetical protein n=1 Tax=Paenibacillus sp. NPDC056933 TaxID=3345968 RepID=UPI00363380AD